METLAIFIFSFLILNNLKLFFAVSSEQFYIKDILSKDLMPGSFIDIMDLGEELNRNLTEIITNEDSKDSLKWNKGSFKLAFSTMNFHRKMVNEYLCRNFLAEEILSKFEVDLPRKHDRHGRPFSLPAPSFIGDRGVLGKKTNMKNVLLADAGSSSYKDWLYKTATFEDIYQHYKNGNDTTKDIGVVIARNDGFATKDLMAADDEEYDGGDITGFAYNNPIQLPEFSGKVGYDHHPTDSYEEYSSHRMGLSDLFEISLTGLAFLSFGMFALQVIMCMTMNQNNQTIVMQSLIKHEGSNNDVMNIDDVRLRGRRSTTVWQPLVGVEAAKALDETSRRVLISMETVLVSSDDQGACLKKSLCESNKYSRTLHDEQKLWIPLWNVGVSWASDGWGAGGAQSLPALDALRAAALGLGGHGVSCIALPTCDYASIRRARDASSASSASDAY